MISVLKIFSKGIRLINSAINGLDKRTVTAIKQGYFFFIFIIMVVAVFIGYNYGSDSAKIKSPPLAADLNQVFDIDRSLEKEEGSFNTMLENELISESKYLSYEKIGFPNKQELKTESIEGIIEPDKNRKIKTDPDMKNRDKQIEGDYRGFGSKKPDIRPLKREIRPFLQKKNENIINTAR